MVRRFISKCAEVGIDGLILPDIPYEEKGEFVEITRKYGLDLVSLIAPTSEGRISRIASEAEGFIYVVSSLGVTGVRSKITTDIGSVCEAIRNASSVPCAIGFGISTPAQAADMARYADGVIVGSAIVKLIAANGVNSAPVVGEYVKTMKDAIKEL